jgi:Resolvase, N terminal domain
VRRVLRKDPSAFELFDTHSVSFVAVTQNFNTTTSMGRLTLNVLLSFAQFEREVIGERIRDKVAASKRKGMWMGGTLPMGYDLRERKLLVNPDEASSRPSKIQTMPKTSALRFNYTARATLQAYGREVAWNRGASPARIRGCGMRRAYRGFRCGFPRFSGVRVRKSRCTNAASAAKRTAQTVAERHRVVASDAWRRLSLATEWWPGDTPLA